MLAELSLARKAPQFLTKYISHYTQIIASTRDRLFPCIQTLLHPGTGAVWEAPYVQSVPGPGVLCRYLVCPLSAVTLPGEGLCPRFKDGGVSTQTTLQQRPVAAAACYDEIAAEVVKLSHWPPLSVTHTRPTPPGHRCNETQMCVSL